MSCQEHCLCFFSESTHRPYQQVKLNMFKISGGKLFNPNDILRWFKIVMSRLETAKYFRYERWPMKCLKEF